MNQQSRYDSGLVLFRITEYGRYYVGRLIGRTSFQYFPGNHWLPCNYDSDRRINDRVMIRVAELFPLTEKEYFLIKIKGGLSREEGKQFWKTGTWISENKMKQGS